LDIQNYQPLNQSVKFSCQKFDFDKHTDYLLDWLEKRKIQIPNSIEVPKLGYLIRTKDSGPVVMGFLRVCEGNVGMIDSLVSNPDIEPAIRDRAMDFLILRLMAAAKRKKIYRVFGFSQDENTLLRASRLGFNTLSQRLVSITLS
jgi:hypothetical protein